MEAKDYVAMEDQYLAQVYKSFPFVLNKAEGVWLWDTDGKKYLDFVSAYSAVSYGHLNTRIRKALIEQLDSMDVQARVFRHDKLGPFAKALCEVTGMDVMLPMNTGAEAVESGIKAARRWGHEVKGIPENKARIIVCDGNFHGRTTTIIGFSSDEEYKRGFGPFDGGFDSIPYGDLGSLNAAITPETCAFIVEPIQGEGGINVPPKGWLKAAQELCQKNNVLFILDEIQTGMARTGKNFCFQHEIDKPDGLMLGKALGGGIYPVSAFLARKDVMDVMDPGSHGSTFGGNAIACVLGMEAINIMLEENLAERAAELGDYLMEKLREIDSDDIIDIRGSGLLVGLEIKAGDKDAHYFCEKLLDKGMISKETHGTVIRFSPPLTITKEEIDWAVEQVKAVFTEM